MLKKLLFRNQDKKQLVIAMVGAFLGITFLVASIHYLIRVNEFGEGAEILGPNTIIVQKKVTNSTTSGLAKTDFVESELEEIRKLPFVTKVEPVISNNFDLWFETDDDLIPTDFKTVAFVQTLSPDFLDVKSDQWKWKEGDNVLPVILPRDLLVMLNTFMSATDIPPLSEEIAQNINAFFEVSNPKNKSEKQQFKIKVIGFTNNVTAMLVPEGFMTYANKKFAPHEESTVTQIMIASTENEFGSLEKVLEEKGLESKKGQVVVARLKSIIGTLIIVLLGISIIAVFASGLVLIQYLQLLMTRNDYEVRTLMRIGYHPNIIIKNFFAYFVKVFSVVTLIGLAAFVPFKYYLDAILMRGGLYIDTGFTLESISAIVIANIIFAISSFLTARKGIYREF